MKRAVAYDRTLRFEKVKKEQAEKAFIKGWNRALF